MTGDATSYLASCGCPWDGLHCPHCGWAGAIVPANGVSCHRLYQARAEAKR